MELDAPKTFFAKTFRRYNSRMSADQKQQNKQQIKRAETRSRHLFLFKKTFDYFINNFLMLANAFATSWALQDD